MRNILLKGLAVGFLLTTSARSATTTIDFNTNPTNNPVYVWHGNVTDISNNPAPWRPTGGASGAANDGYLAVTDSRGGLSSNLIFNDLEHGLIIKAFTFECDLRIGGGTEPPADGFSINLASPTDASVVAADTGGTPGTWNGTGSDGIGGGGGEANLPEEGTRTGLAIGFDAWQSGTIFGAQDVAGISIRFNTQLIAQLPIPLLPDNVYLPSEPLPGAQGTNYFYTNTAAYHNLATNDPNYLLSMQTGSRNPNVPSDTQPAYGSTNYNDWIQNLRWEHFKAEVTEDLKVKVTWKGVELTPPGGLDISTLYSPSSARIVFAGRTGGSWQVMHVDNLQLTTIPFTGAAITAFRGNAGGFTIEVTDQNGVSLVKSSVALQLNGSAVTPNIADSTDGLKHYLVYQTAPNLLVVGTTNTVNITYNDSNGGGVTNAIRRFIVGSYATIPAAYANTTVDTSQLGFGVRPHQIPRARGPGDANTIANAERQIANGFIDPSTGQPYVNMLPSLYASFGNGDTNADGYYSIPVINWNENPGANQDPDTNPNAADAGNFRNNVNAPLDVVDLPTPGVYTGPDFADPTNPQYNDNIVEEVKAYLDIPAGFYTFGVNSDDGFKVTASRGLGDVLGVTLGSFNGGKGASDVLFDVYVPTSGIFPVRLLYWEGGGGSECEFFYLDPVTTQKILVNDQPSVHIGGVAGSASPIKAYMYNAATTTRPYVARVSPEPGQQFVFADTDVTAWLADGTVTVDPANVSLTVNGTTVTGGTKPGGSGVTTITSTGGLANLRPGGGNSASLIYSYTDPANGAVTVTNTWSFNVVPYTIIPAAYAASGVNLTAAGFQAFVDQIDRTLDTNQGNGTRITGGSDQNRMPWPDVELAGGNINPTNNQRYPNLALAGAGGNWTYDVANINFNSNPANGNTGVANGDTQMPGLPGGSTTVTGGIRGIESYAAEFRGYVNLPAGVYVMAVNSDDGFVATVAPDPHDTLGTVVGFFNGGRGNSNPLPNPPTTKPVPAPGNGGNSTFSVVVPTTGIYPFRILYWQGGGGVNAEFVSIDKASGLQPVVGSANTTPSITNAVPLSAYRTGPSKPWVKFSVSPTPWDNRHQQVGPGPITMIGRTVNSTASGDIYNSADNTRPFADVVGGTVANGVGDPTLALLINGAPVAATFTTNGNDVTLRYTTPLPSGSANTASLVYGGTTNSWSFTVQTYTNLNASDSLPASAADLTAPGFSVKMYQATNLTGYTQNTVALAEAQVVGLLGNVATNTTYIYPNIINWNNNRNAGHSGVELGNFQANVYGSGWPTGDHPDEPVPGIPGTGMGTSTDNCAAEIFSYWNFPSAGYYHLGINSDDGFAVKVGTPGNTNGTVITSVNVGKGSSDIPFSVMVPQAGLYPIRVVWYNGGGGANVEVFSYDSNGVKVPINGTASGAIKTYYRVTSTAAPMFTSATVSGGQLTLTWSGSGSVIVQTAPALNGSWTDGPTVTGNTYSAPVGASGNLFYRLKQ